MMPTPLLSFRCRLCWGITLAVFLLIIAVESIILLPSVIQYRLKELQQLAQTAQIIITPQLGSKYHTPESLETALRSTGKQYGLAGVAVYDLSGTMIAHAGQHMKSFQVPDSIGYKAAPLEVIDEKQLLYSGWQSKQPDGRIVVAAIDASEVRQNVIDYVKRILALISIIVLVVTIGTMLVLNFSVLRPLLFLKNNLITVGNSYGRADSFKIDTQRKDEIGELINAYNQMLDQLTTSYRRNRELADQQAFYHARHDIRTGLPNQAALEEFLDLQLQRGQEAILVQIEYIHFGHHKDDQHLLHQITSRIKSALRSDDYIAMLGADNFSIARIGAYSLDSAERFVEHLLHVLASRPYLDQDNTALTVDVKAGIADSSRHIRTGRELLAETSVALSRARDNAECAYAFYSMQYAQAALERQKLTQDLKQALSQRALFLVVQPKVSLLPQCDTELVGAEVLVRWQHPEKGTISPDVFIPIAEENGLIRALGEWVLESACEYINQWLHTCGWSPRLAINISAREFSDPEFAQRIQATLQKHKVSTEYVELEITETTAIEHADATLQNLVTLHNSGICILIDDFGTGYSSLSMLRQLPVDSVKIDKSLIQDIGFDANAEAVCSVILRLGQTLCMTVIAEGVENQQQLEFLCQRKCDQAQGYLFGRPMLLSEFESQWLQHA